MGQFRGVYRIGLFKTIQVVALLTYEYDSAFLKSKVYILL